MHGTSNKTKQNKHKTYFVTVILRLSKYAHGRIFFFLILTALTYEHFQDLNVQLTALRARATNASFFVDVKITNGRSLGARETRMWMVKYRKR